MATDIGVANAVYDSRSYYLEGRLNNKTLKTINPTTGYTDGIFSSPEFDMPNECV